jgi:HAD superfamily hydrolase (TIGR01549 family)
MRRRIIYAFDWDNTLIDSHLKGLRCMCRALSELGIFFSENRIKEIYCPDYHEMYKRIKIPEKHWGALDTLWLECYNTEETTPLFPEVREVLTELLKKGNIIAIITTGQRSRVHRELEYLKLKPFFTYIICREDVANVKPAPDAIELIKEHDPFSEIIYIGDHDHDVEMAKMANVRWYKIIRDSNEKSSRKQKIIKDLRELLAV